MPTEAVENQKTRFSPKYELQSPKRLDVKNRCREMKQYDWREAEKKIQRRTVVVAGVLMCGHVRILFIIHKK